MKNKILLENTDGNKKSGIFYSKRLEGIGGGGGWRTFGGVSWVSGGPEGD